MFKYNMFDKYIATLGKENTVSSYTNILSRFSNEFEIIDEKSLDGLRTGHYKEYVSGMVSEDYSRRTIILHLTVIIGFLRWVLDYDLISEDCIPSMKRLKKSLPKDDNRRSGKLISDEDLSSLLSSDNKALAEALLMNTLYFTGRRRGDIANIKIGDIQIEDGYSIISFPEEQKTGKSSKIKLPEHPTNLLVRYMKERLGDGIKEMSPTMYLFGSYLFVKESPMTPQSIRNVIIRVIDGLKIETQYSPKDFRFSRGHWIYHNVSPYTAMAFLRHSSLAITESFYKTENTQTMEAVADAVFDADLDF